MQISIHVMPWFVIEQGENKGWKKGEDLAEDQEDITI